MMRATLEVVIEVLFQAHVGDEAGSLIEAILEMDKGYGFDPVEAVLGDFLPPLDASLSARAQAARGRLVSFIGRLIAVDEERAGGMARVDALRARLERVYAGRADDDPIDRAFAAVVERLRRHRAVNLVVDPVLRSTSGRPLLAVTALPALRDVLLPLATVFTPNLE